MDLILVESLRGFSRSQVQRLIRQGNVLVNQAEVKKSGHTLQGGEQLEILIPAPTPSKLVPEDIPLDVIFENQDLIVINKPAGMVVHPSAGHDQGTLVHAVLSHAPDIRGVGGEIRPGVVHRLDKDTSGLILMAKHDTAHRALQRCFKEREVSKVYLALVDGHPPTREGRVEAPLGRDPRHRKKMAVVSRSRGRASSTDYLTREIFSEHSLLEVRPETGRTHQIRVHMAFLGCPVVGDRVYGHRRPTIPLKRHFLHAQELTINLPGDRQPTSFQAPLPDELQELLDQLRMRE